MRSGIKYCGELRRHVSACVLVLVHILSHALKIYFQLTCVALLAAYDRVTPPGVAMHRFVVQHSVMLSAMPFLNAVGGGVTGIAVAVGVDMTSGGRVALAALGAAAVTTLVVAGTALSAQVGLVRALRCATATVSTKTVPNPIAHLTNQRM